MTKITNFIDIGIKKFTRQYPRDIYPKSIFSIPQSAIINFCIYHLNIGKYQVQTH